MPDDTKGHSFYERRWFRSVVAVLGVVTAVLAIVGPLRSVIGDLFPDPTPPSFNAQVIFDTSEAMGGPFQGEETRREAGLEALRSSRFWPTEAVGLRRTDPSCAEGDPDDLLVPLGTGHTDEVHAAAEEQKPEGRPNLVGTLFAALSKFSEPPYDDYPPYKKRVIVFTAGVDRCGRDPAAELDELLGDSGAQLARSQFKLFGLKSSPREGRRLTRLKATLERAGAEARIWPAENRRQLFRGVEEMNQEGEARPGLPQPERTMAADG